MDKTLTALVARFPCLEWRAEKNYHIGERGGLEVVAWDDGGKDAARWRARGIVGTVRLFTRAASAVEAVEKLAVEPDFRDALSGLPAEPEGWDVPDDPMPGPAALGCPALAALVGLAGVAGLLLWLGWLGVWWLTGGTS